MVQKTRGGDGKLYVLYRPWYKKIGFWLSMLPIGALILLLLTFKIQKHDSSTIKPTGKQVEASLAPVNPPATTNQNQMTETKIKEEHALEIARGLTTIEGLKDNFRVEYDNTFNEYHLIAVNKMHDYLS
ncbi:hypothetical protein OZX68_03340 [Streptococcaceae bacterium ESL0729]|nr:hypothetical protein OZX68_03340 [Streptococcaceae bacterium ESL0729]